MRVASLRVGRDLGPPSRARNGSAASDLSPTRHPGCALGQERAREGQTQPAPDTATLSHSHIVCGRVHIPAAKPGGCDRCCLPFPDSWPAALGMNLRAGWWARTLRVRGGVRVYMPGIVHSCPALESELFTFGFSSLSCFCLES